MAKQIVRLIGSATRYSGIEHSRHVVRRDARNWAGAPACDKLSFQLALDHPALALLRRLGIRSNNCQSNKVIRHGRKGIGSLALFREFRPDVALLDIGMPGLDGYEVARRLREQPSLRHTRLIALTGWGQLDDKARAATAGFDLHLTKPADIGAIEAILSLPLDESDASAQSG